MSNSNKLPLDPEKYLTVEKIGIGTPDGFIDERLGSVSGKHTYELCLFETYQQTEKRFKENQALGSTLVNPG